MDSISITALALLVAIVLLLAFVMMSIRQGIKDIYEQDDT